MFEWWIYLSQSYMCLRNVPIIYIICNAYFILLVSEFLFTMQVYGVMIEMINTLSGQAVLSIYSLFCLFNLLCLADDIMSRYKHQYGTYGVVTHELVFIENGRGGWHTESIIAL